MLLHTQSFILQMTRANVVSKKEQNGREGKREATSVSNKDMACIGVFYTYDLNDFV